MNNMYGNQPKLWSPKLKGMDRLRFIINAFTRMRYCAPNGALALNEKGPPGTQAKGRLPWFDMPHRASADERILCGHWSTLGYINRNNVWALDTGCLWGNQLTAVQVHRTKAIRPIQVSCDGIPLVNQES